MTISAPTTTTTTSLAARFERAAKRAGRRGCVFCADQSLQIDYKDPQLLGYFITDRGKLVPRRVSGCCALHQRKLANEIKRARQIALLPFTSQE